MQLLKLKLWEISWTKTIVQGFLLFVVSQQHDERRVPLVIDMRPRPGSGWWKVGRIGFEQPEEARTEIKSFRP